MANAMATLPGLLATLGLALVCACGGGGGGGGGTSAKTVADTLTYTDPAPGGFRFVRDPSSTATHLVLDLVGPAAGTCHGLALDLSCPDGCVTWSRVAPGDAAFAENAPPFDLGNVPRMSVVKVSGRDLQVGFFQKQGLASPVSINQVLVKVAVDLDPDQALHSCVSLIVRGGEVLMADGTLTDLSQSPNQVQVGTLYAD
jgi:hypothetical protein